jgi:mRNA interferase RelE/StbE
MLKASLRRLRVPRDVAELIRGLHPQIKRKVRAALEQVLVDPRSGKRLRDELAGLWSFRVGKFRLIYRFDRRLIDLVAFGPRDRIYEETYRLIARK